MSCIVALNKEMYTYFCTSIWTFNFLFRDASPPLIESMDRKGYSWYICEFVLPADVVGRVQPLGARPGGQIYDIAYIDVQTIVEP